MLAAVMCVERNAPLLSLTELCKSGLVETFAWYSVGPQPPCAQAEHTLSGMLLHTYNTHTKTQSQEDPALKIFKLLLLEGRQSDTRRANHLGYHTHHQDSPSFFQIYYF